MLERPILPFDGSAVSLTSLNKQAAAAAHVDDYILAELLKFAPYAGSAIYDKGVIPYQARGTNGAFVKPGPSGALPIVVMPFRAILGSRTLLTDTIAPPPPAGAGDPLLQTAAEQNYRDLRSALYITQYTSGGSQILGYAIPAALFATNTDPTHSRWDLVYAVMSVDTTTSSVQLQVKPAAGGAAAPLSAAPSVVTTIGTPAFAANGIGVVPGTPGLPPSIPTLPADVPASGTFYFPLAMVRIPPSFTSGTTTLPQNAISILAPIVRLAEAMGGRTLRPADSISGPNSITMRAGSTPTSVWGASGRPPQILPSTMMGGPGVIFQMDATGATGSNTLATNTATVDATIDWRKRHFFSLIQVAGNSGSLFATDPSVTLVGVPCCQIGQTQLSIMGQGYFDDSLNSMGAPITGGAGGVFLLNGNNAVGIPGPTSTNAFGVYVDLTTGQLRVYYLGTPGVRMFCRIEATGAYGEL